MGKIIDEYILITNSGDIYVEKFSETNLKTALLNDKETYNEYSFLSKYPDDGMDKKCAIIIHLPTGDIIKPEFSMDVKIT